MSSNGLSKYARKDCLACKGRGVVRVDHNTTALCGCLPSGWPRVAAAQKALRADAKKRAGLD